jgi:hypothetical protein
MIDAEQRTTRSQGDGDPQQLAKAHEDFRARLQSAWPSAEAERSVTDAFAVYTAILQQPWTSPEYAARTASAYRDYKAQVHEAFAGAAGEQVVDAYRIYLRKVKAFWAALNPASLEPQDLGAIAQGMSWVAGVAVEVAAARSSAAESRSQT